MGHPVYASIAPTVEIEVEGVWYQGHPQTHMDPGHPAWAEATHVGRFLISYKQNGKWLLKDLFEGVDRHDATFKLILSNLWDAIQDDADETLADAFDIGDYRATR